MNRLNNEGHKAKYEFKNDRIKMLKMLRMSRHFKEKHRWSREIGAGFVSEDITTIELLYNKKLLMKFPWGQQTMKPIELNLRETDEAIKFLSRIYVSQMNPCLSIKHLIEIGYDGRTADEVLEKVKKHYPSAHLI
jgi:hypothetical protein